MVVIDTKEEVGFLFFFTGEDEVFRDKQGSQPHVYTCHVSSYRDRGTILPVTSEP